VKVMVGRRLSRVGYGAEGDKNLFLTYEITHRAGGRL